ncbi:hypothetical protein WICPIJ_005440 [Wickerhamomyces pijperi]|uniref:Uncharacterized protein n=1 Tax=Wickerhamomyces pijperi TaxID=599730 RepID=A0A9P8Q3I8_WICPI|nr:hypothetical protein WICPIJ_005440 [Wickerhamomyces pijperi]
MHRFGASPNLTDFSVNNGSNLEGFTPNVGQLGRSLTFFGVRDFQSFVSGEQRLDRFPHLLLWVQNLFWSTVVAFKEHLFTSLGAGWRFNKLNLAFWVSTTQNHGGGLDTSHSDRLQVGNDNNVTFLHSFEREVGHQTGTDGSWAFFVTTVDGGDVQGVGVWVLDGLFDEPNTEINDRWR